MYVRTYIRTYIHGIQCSYYCVCLCVPCGVIAQLVVQSQWLRSSSSCSLSDPSLAPEAEQACPSFLWWPQQGRGADSRGEGPPRGGGGKTGQWGSNTEDHHSSSPWAISLQQFVWGFIFTKFVPRSLFSRYVFIIFNTQYIIDIQGPVHENIYVHANDSSKLLLQKCLSHNN